LAKFLSDEYMEAATAALNSDAAFSSAITNVSLGIEFTVTGAPEGDITYGLSVADGGATLSRGELPGADVTVTNDYETAVSMNKGDLNTQMAFMTGKVKVGGNMAALLMNQNVINQFAPALSGLDIEY
jgi:hypothetical protein